VTTPDGGLDGREGRNVGRYRILGFLGSGAMGEVYLAEDPHIERKLAIKTVRLAGRPAEIEDRTKRLLREARAAGRLLHPNIVTLFDAGEAEGQLYLAFEFVEGTDLAGRLEAGPPLTLRDVLRMVRQVAEALDYAHRQGIVHRDIKPSNVLLDTTGRVKVADFGIAKVTGQSTELTVAGSVMGSPQYLSPEQIRGDELDGRSDVFSLGVVLYELLSRKRPFDGETITTLVYQILHKEPPPVSSLRSIPPRLEQLLRSMLAKDKAERIATAGQVAEELAAIERELDDETLSAPAARENGAMAPTAVLPRSTAAPVIPIPAPPSPALAVPTHRSGAAPPAPPPVPAPVRPATGRSMVATEGISPKLWLPLVAVVVLVAAVTAGWLMLGRRGAAPQPAEQVATGPATPVQPVAGTPTPLATSSPAPVSSPPVQPAETPEPRRKDLSEVRSEPAFPEPQPRREPAQPPALEPRRNEPAPPLPGTTTPERTTIEIRGEETPAPEPEAPAEQPSLGAADPVMRTGLALAFRVTPPDAFVVVDGRVIGPARRYSAQKGAQAYNLPGPGQYRIAIKKEGMKEHRIAVEASEIGGVTPIFARLSPLPATELDASDLPVVRVSKGIAFRVRPVGAMVLVDGQPAGPAAQYGGGLRPGGWLQLPEGRHRVTVAARGHRRYDVIVEVFPGAPKERERIEVNLLAGGGE
jgi:serine/threonine-protein kinase